MEPLKKHLSRMATAQTDVHNYCQNVINSAETGPELRAAAVLVAGAQQDNFGDLLRDKIIGRMRKAAGDPALGMAEAADLGEGLVLLERLSSN